MFLELPSSAANLWAFHLQKSQVSKTLVFPQETIAEFFSCSASGKDTVCLVKIFAFSPMTMFSVCFLLIITCSSFEFYLFFFLRSYFIFFNQEKHTNIPKLSCILIFVIYEKLLRYFLLLDFYLMWGFFSPLKSTIANSVFIFVLTEWSHMVNLIWVDSSKQEKDYHIPKSAIWSCLIARPHQITPFPALCLWVWDSDFIVTTYSIGLQWCKTIFPNDFQTQSILQ